MELTDERKIGDHEEKVTADVKCESCGGIYNAILIEGMENICNDCVHKIMEGLNEEKDKVP